MKEHDDGVLYASPLVSRYAGRPMLELFGPRRRAILWRRLWIALARAQAELGLPIDLPALAALEARIEEIDFDRIATLESETRHDVMAHLLAFTELAPEAGRTLHLGATSAFVTDNADLILLREALDITIARLRSVIAILAEFARTHRALPILGRTHLQPAQPTTLGKRATLWIYDFASDLEEMVEVRNRLHLRGVKGTTGTQDAFLALFEGDGEKIDRLDEQICASFDFDRSYPVTGQTYPRKIDARILAALSGLAQSAARFAGDIRLMAMLREVEEPIAASQVGSSAMPYKRNPMRCERISALARHGITLAADAAWTAAEQRFERTLDDSANRRIALPEAFLTADACLRLTGNVGRGLDVHPAVIECHLAEELPLLISERILMAASTAGGDRQDLHERIRQITREYGNRLRTGQADSDQLIKQFVADPELRSLFAEGEANWNATELIGNAPRQVDRFLAEFIDPLLGPDRSGDPADWDLTA